MSSMELLVFGVFSLLAFWGVTYLLDLKSGKTSEPPPKQADVKSDNAWQAPNSAEPGADYATEKWFVVLDVAEDANLETIVDAYKKKIRQYHPDKVATLGPELLQLAEMKTKQINVAYEHAIRLRG